MEPLSALSIASAVIQIVDFSAKVISRTKEVYDSPEKATEETALLENATENLRELMEELSKRRNIRPHNSSNADDQLIHLAKQSDEIAKVVCEAVDDIRLRTDGSQRTALSQGLRSVLGQKKISSLTARLDQMRKQVDTALLVSLRQQIGNLVEMRSIPADDIGKSKIQLLQSLRDRDWKPTEQRDLIDFSEGLKTSVNMDLEDRFFNLMISRLHFQDLDNRYEIIPEAHRDTFQWMFDNAAQRYNPDDYDSFTDWLSSDRGDNLFWATGKPGSGKSTLMKFLFNDNRLTAKIQEWAHDLPLVKAGFFFWNSGTAIQMSRTGLVRTLLHSALSSDKQTLLRVFDNRWQQFVAFGGGRQALAWHELRRAFDTMVAEPITPRKFLFMIDGLDEFDGDSKELVELVLNLSNNPHVKVCVASRPWLVFSDAFEGRPSLRLERLTRNDIRKYVASYFADNKHYKRISKLDPNRATSLVETIIEKASGVFLWVYLVVQSLLDGLSNADRMSDLVVRLESLPPDVEELYGKLLASLDTNYFKHACQLFRLVMLRPRPLLIELYYADNDDEDDQTTMLDKLQVLTRDQIMDRVDTMQRRLVSRCKGLLEIEDWRSNPDKALSDYSRVGWIHRTARDFLRSKAMWRDVLDTSGHDFEPDRSWAHGFLNILKYVEESPVYKWSDILWCIHYALLVEERLHVCPMTYLEDVHRAAKLRCIIYRKSQFAKTFSYEGHRKVPPLHDFVDFAVWVSHVGYFRLKAPTMTRAELKHAAEWRNLDKNVDNNSEHGLGRRVQENAKKTLLIDRHDLLVSWAIDHADSTQRAPGIEFPLDKVELEHALDSALKGKKEKEVETETGKEKGKGKGKGRPTSIWRRAKNRVFS